MASPGSSERADRGAPALVAGVCGVVLVLGGVLVLLGWWGESALLVQLHPGLPAMRANAAVVLVLVGLGILAGRQGWWSLAAFLAVLSAVLPAFDIIDWALGRDIGADLFLFQEQQAHFDEGVAEPGRLPIGAAVNLLCLSVGIGALRTSPRVAHTATLAAGLMALLGFSATLYDSSAVPQLEGSPGVSLHGAALSLVAAVGILALQPRMGLAGVLGEPGRIGRMLRQSTGIAVVLPLLVSLVGMAGIRAGRYDATFAVGLVSTAWTAVLIALIWWGGLRTIPVEREGDRSRGEASAGRDRLALLAEVSSEFAATPDLSETLDRVTGRIASSLDAGCAVRLVDPTGRFLEPVAVHHPDPSRQAALNTLLDRVIRVDEGLSGHVVTRSLPGLLAADTHRADVLVKDPELRAALDEYGRPSALVASLRVGGQVLGAITVLRDEDQTPLDEADLDLVVGLADRAAQAIHNALLVGEQSRQDASFAQFAADALVTHSPGVLRAMAVRHLAEALQARHAVLIEPDGDELLPTVLRVTAATERDDRLAMPIGAPVAAAMPLRVLRTGEPYVCDDMRDDVSPEMAVLADVLGSDSGLAVAVPGREGPRGVLTVVAVGRARFSDDEVDLARAFAGLLSGALQRMDAELSLTQVAEERRALLDRLVSAQEDERARIADGVHQDQVQVIAAADLRLGILARRAGELDEALAEDLTFARDAVSGAAERLRALLFELEPPDPTASLDDAVSEAAAYLLEPVGTSWTVESTSTARLDQSHLTTAYRIAKEALANAGRHARADRVEVTISDVDDGVSVQVRDDGVGMAEVPLRSAAGHLGMSSIRDWVEVAGGRLDIVSAPGEGTVVDFWLPQD
ncbi:sensor histidine kinase [Nocardioides bigeumensis]